jgi:hypothetical protein
LCVKLVSRFSTSIPIKKSFTWLFGVTQGEKESTRSYLRRFNEEMLEVEDLLGPIACEALIKGVEVKSCGNSSTCYKTELLKVK